MRVMKRDVNFTDIHGFENFENFGQTPILRAPIHTREIPSIEIELPGSETHEYTCRTRFYARSTQKRMGKSMTWLRTKNIAGPQLGDFIFIKIDPCHQQTLNPISAGRLRRK